MPVFKKAAKRFSPARTLVLGFLIIITAGALLLCLPISSKTREFTSLFDCLFTATSASCVTGLSVFDTYTHWSLFGQIVIALLIQVGGLGFLTIITFFNVAAGKKLGYRTLVNVGGDFSESTMESGRGVFIRIMKYSLIFELCGAVVLGFAFVPKHGAYGVWISVFMSISAFCNAGFDLLGMNGEGSSVISMQKEPMVLITLAILIIIGGLGFIVWENFLTLKQTKKLSLHTKVVLFMTAVLVVGGTIFYLISENGKTMKDMPFGEKLLNSFFASVSTRTAGFDNLGMSETTEFSQLGTILLMFIGAAPGSTGGGIKVTTLMVLIVTVVSYIRNKNDVELFKHKLDKLTIYRTLVISVLSIFAVGMCFVFLYFSVQDHTKCDAVQCLFDAVSAFSTSGLSTGATALTGVAGRILLIFTMFIGRIGPVSIVMSLVMKSANRKNIVVPDGHILIG